jgi:hypothetical protein
VIVGGRLVACPATTSSQSTAVDETPYEEARRMALWWARACDPYAVTVAEQSRDGQRTPWQSWAGKLKRTTIDASSAARVAATWVRIAHLYADEQTPTE